MKKVILAKHSIEQAISCLDKELDMTLVEEQCAELEKAKALAIETLQQLEQIIK